MGLSGRWKGWGDISLTGNQDSPVTSSYFHRGQGFCSCAHPWPLFWPPNHGPCSLIYHSADQEKHFLSQNPEYKLYHNSNPYLATNSHWLPRPNVLFPGEYFCPKGISNWIYCFKFTILMHLHLPGVLKMPFSTLLCSRSRCPSQLSSAPNRDALLGSPLLQIVTRLKFWEGGKM